MTSTITIKQLLDINFDHLSPWVVKQFSTTELMCQVKKKLEEDNLKLDWDKLVKIILKQAEIVLNKPVYALLDVAWKEHDEIKKYNEVGFKKQTIMLSDHKIKSKYLPVFELELEGDTIDKIPFFLGVSLDLKGVSIMLDTNHQWVIKSGLMDGEIILQYKNITLCEKTFSCFQLTRLLNSQPKKEETFKVQKVINLIDLEKPISLENSNELSSVSWFIIGAIISFFTLFIFWLLQ